MHPKLNFPEYIFKIKQELSSHQIFDVVRKKYVALTPEEWVRQHVIHLLIQKKKMAKGLMQVETTVKYNRMNIRCDVLVYTNELKPFLLVECKAPGVEITQAAFDQIARYNMPLKVKYLMLTNGLFHYYCLMDYERNSYSFVDDI
jgi:hypothetical protein